MTDWPADYGGLVVGDDTYAVSLETLANIRLHIAARAEWITVPLLLGDELTVRTVRIDATYTNSREGRRQHTEFRQFAAKQLKEDVPEWEDAG